VRRRRRCEDNIKTDLKGTGCEVVDWILVAQNRNRVRWVGHVARMGDKCIQNFVRET
jgi:hypothetical protein